MKQFIKCLIGLLILGKSAVAQTTNRNNVNWLPTMTRADVRYQQFITNRDPYTPQYDDRYLYKAALDFRIDALRGYLFWDNTLHTEAIEGAVKTVGWHWFVGARVIPSGRIELLYEHHSRHIMDESPKVIYRDADTANGGGKYKSSEIDGRRYPVEDSVGIRFKLLP